jgi:hypothetical protein
MKLCAACTEARAQHLQPYHDACDQRDCECDCNLEVAEQ